MNIFKAYSLLMVFLALIPVLNAALQVQNILQDGSFEEWVSPTDLTYWDEIGQVTRSNDAIDGEYSVSLGSNSAVYQVVPSSPDAIHTLTFWYKLESNKELHVLVRWLDESYNELMRWEAYTIGYSPVEWRSFSHQLLQNPPLTAYLEIRFFTPLGSLALVDNATLSPPQIQLNIEIENVELPMALAGIKNRKDVREH